MKKRFNLIILGCLILGIIGGLFLPNVMSNTAFIGTIYINLLKFMIIPIIFTTITVASYNSKKGSSKKLFKTVGLFVLMFIAIFLITSVIVFFLSKSITYFSTPTHEVETTTLKVGEIITNLFPDNIITMISGNLIFACIILAFAFGVAATKVENGKNVIDVINGIKNITNKLLEWIMYLTPLAVLSLAGTTTATYGSVIIGIAASYIGIAYICSAVALVLFMILPVWIINKINPIDYIKGMSKLWMITISTCSSLAALPETIKTCKEEFKMDSKTADIYIPVGCTIHKCGGAVSFALLSIFSCHFLGIEITLASYIMMLINATLINMAAPGIPSGGIVLGATYLALLDIPLTFIGIYAGIYRLLDMSYTTLNVTGNVSANIIMNKKS